MNSELGFSSSQTLSLPEGYRDLYYIYSELKLKTVTFPQYRKNKMGSDRFFMAQGCQGNDSAEAFQGEHQEESGGSLTVGPAPWRHPGTKWVDFEVAELAKPESFYYPLVMSNIAIENDHRNSGFSH